ncbi:MAG: site-specific integrase [Phycisphaerae bacterium]|nr:site-specific integrase [Phycisphaerae bacterium]
MRLTHDRFLNELEANALLEHVSSEVRAARHHDVAAQLDELIITSLILSGLRTSELCTLQVGDTILGVGKSVFRVRGLSGRSRTIWVPQNVSALVQRYVADVRRRCLPGDVDHNDLAQPLVFSERRRPYERNGLYRRVVRVLTRAGLAAKASVQILRHTYGYLAYLRTGGNLLFVQRQLGHSHPRITSVYARFVDESYEELSERVGEWSEAASARSVPVRAQPEFNCEID